MAKIADVQEVSLEKLRPYERNAKKHSPRQIEKLKASMEEFGFLTPCLIDNEYNLIAGHGRVMAAKELGITSVPCVFIEGLTEEQRRAYILADNRLGELGEWDMELVLDELTELDDLGFDIELTGFEMPDEESDVVEDDFDEDSVPEEPRCKLGDLWQLGDHRLICGDSTDVNVIERLMDGQKADMVFTDPPYGVNYSGGMAIKDGKIQSNNRKTIQNDALDYLNLYEFLYDAFINMRIHTKDKSAFYIFYAHSRSREFLNAFYDADLKQRSIIIWHKVGGGFGDFMAQYMNAYEPCIYGSNGDSVNWYGATNEKTVWEIEKESKCDLHPTMKPIALCSRAIINSSRQDDGVLDIFGGSGSTLIACEQLNRKCYMCELDEHYCDVIINRWETLTGREAVLING